MKEEEAKFYTNAMISLVVTVLINSQTAFLPGSLVKVFCLQTLSNQKRQNASKNKRLLGSISQTNSLHDYNLVAKNGLILSDSRAVRKTLIPQRYKSAEFANICLIGKPI